MSTFKFNFSNQEYYDKDTKDNLAWLECEEVKPKEQIKELDQIVKHAKLYTCLDIDISHVVMSEALANIQEKGFKNSILSAEKNHSDLISAKYEGGLKIWECTYDLLQYLIINKDDIIIKDSNILDLGCGAGILGIYTLINGAYVTFQDYNKEVLEHVTIPNILINFDEDERENIIKKCKFYCGDWGSFDKKLEHEIYDIIVTSETIYNESNYHKLLGLFKRLKKDGAIYVAGKTCYFGVGGGMRQFEETIKKSGSFKYQVCWINTTGIQREILKIIKI